MSVVIYNDPRWPKLKDKVYKRYGRRCMATGMTEAQGVTLSVDHIKPISKRPDLAFKFSNLQILAMPVNSMKSNKTETDYRPLTTRFKYAMLGLIKYPIAILVIALLCRYYYLDVEFNHATITNQIKSDAIEAWGQIEKLRENL